MENNEWWWPRAWVPPSTKNPSSNKYVPQHLRAWIRSAKAKLRARSLQSGTKFT